jgi:hypothetical protein
MSKAKVVLFLSALASLTGRIGLTSLHPLASPDARENVFDPALMGTWEEAETAGDVLVTRFTVTRADSGYSYSMVSESGGMSGTMSLMKTGDRYLLDVYCPSEGEALPRAPVRQAALGKGRCLGVHDG